MSPVMKSLAAFRRPAPKVDGELLEQLFDHTPDLVFFIKDWQGRYVAVNQSLVERYGFKSRAQLLGRRPSELCPGDFGRIPAEQDAAVLRTGRPILERLELHWYSPQKPGWCLTTKLPLRSETGEVTGLIGISKDVRAPILEQEIPAGVAAALQALERDFAEPLSPASLAKVAGLSATRFARIIKRVHGLTPTQLISRHRLSAASRLLRETTHSVSTIALDCGFQDHSAFTRAFRAAMGITPTEFRAR